MVCVFVSYVSEHIRYLHFYVNFNYVMNVYNVDHLGRCLCCLVKQFVVLLLEVVFLR